MVTSVDLAAHLGLSQSTVSRVMRGDPVVASETTRRVLEAAQKLGYVPNAAARTLVTRRTRAVGVVVADLTSPFYPTVVDVIQRCLSDRGYRMALIRDPDEEHDNVDSVALLDTATVDGIIFVSARRESRSVRQVLARNTPVVLLSRDDPTLSLELVSSDDSAAGELVIEHLVSLGHRRIAVLSVPRERTNGAAREDSARAALERRGMALPDDYVRRATHHDDGVAATRSLLSNDVPPTALYCVNDELAFSALDAVAQLGLAVPRDLSVVGFDDSLPARWAMINLTTVHQPIGDMAAKAVTLLLDRLDHGAEEQPGNRVFPVTLQIRGTTGQSPSAT